MMQDENVIDAARHSMTWWNRYYHLLLYLHFALGALGILVGALIAADFTEAWGIFNTQVLGVISTVIVGIVSFVQPGRMASVFFDAYWRMRVAILRFSEGQLDKAALIDAIANGFTAVAEIQPEVLDRDDPWNNDARGKLTEEQKAEMLALRKKFQKQNVEAAKTAENNKAETPKVNKE